MTGKAQAAFATAFAVGEGACASGKRVEKARLALNSSIRSSSQLREIGVMVRKPIDGDKTGDLLDLGGASGADLRMLKIGPLAGARNQST